MLTILGQSVDMSGILFTVLIIALPGLISRGQSFYAYVRRPADANVASLESPYKRVFIVLVTLHSIYVIYNVLRHVPFNLFRALRIPLNTPTSLIRAKLVSSTGGPPTPQIDALLTRLQSVDVRGYYVRFGHDAVEFCDYCHSFGDFGLFSVPLVGLQYVRVIGLVAAMTVRGSGKRTWRKWVVGSLVAASLLEAWTLCTVEVPITSDLDEVVMWHDRAWYLRHALFLFIPIVLHLLPYQANPLAALNQVPVALNSVEQTLASLQVLNGVRVAALRDEDLRNRTVDYWAHEALTSRLAQQDTEVREEAARAGLMLEGGDDSLMSMARSVVEQWRRKLSDMLRDGLAGERQPTLAATL